MNYVFIVLLTLQSTSDTLGVMLYIVSLDGERLLNAWTCSSLSLKHPRRIRPYALYFDATRLLNAWTFSSLF